MIVKQVLSIAIAATFVLPVLARAQTTLGRSQAAMPTDAEIREFLADRIDRQHKSVGMVVGIISPEGRHVVSYGRSDQNDQRPLDGDTVFEIGSITKIFTALLLSDMVEHDEVSLNDPIGNYLPAGVKVPQRNGREITLADLATHTSGLPFFPTDIPVSSVDKAIPVVAKYSVPQLYEFLSKYELPRDAGSKWEYSNLGFALLGLALSHRAGIEYEALVRRRITGPLNMKSTAVIVSPEMKTRLAVGNISGDNAARVGLLRQIAVVVILIIDRAAFRVCGRGQTLERVINEIFIRSNRFDPVNDSRLLPKRVWSESHQTLRDRR